MCDQERLGTGRGCKIREALDDGSYSTLSLMKATKKIVLTEKQFLELLDGKQKAMWSQCKMRVRTEGGTYYLPGGLEPGPGAPC